MPDGTQILLSDLLGFIFKVKEGTLHMEKPKTLSDWDFPDTEMVPDGYDMTTIPSMSGQNFRILIEEHNKLVEVVNMLCESRNIVFDE